MPTHPAQTSVIRLFGLSTKEVTAILRRAAQRGCPGLKLLSRDDEFAVCIRAMAPTQQAADAQCKQWERTLIASFGSAVYGTGEIDLAQAALTALLRNDRLVVAGDRTTGEMLSSVWRELKYSDSVYDFGRQSWANPQLAGRLEVPEAVDRRVKGDAIQRAAWMAGSARRVSESDFAVCYIPAVVSSTEAVALVTDGQTVWMDRIPGDAGEMTCANHLLDLLRRLALELELPPSISEFRLGGAPEDDVDKADTNEWTKDAPPLGEEEEKTAIDRELDRFTLANLGLEPFALGQAGNQPLGAANRQTRHMPRGVSDTYDDAREVDGALGESLARGQAMRSAVQRIYRPGGEDDDFGDLPDLTEHHRHQRRRKRAAWGWMLLVLLCCAAVVAAFVLFMLRDTRVAPDFSSYGTAKYDEEVWEYLSASMEKEEGVTAYLALPGQAGALVYQSQTTDEEQPTRDWADPAVALGTPLANAVVYCQSEGLSGLSAVQQLDQLRLNSGFTLYQSGLAYRYKVMAVLDAPSAEEAAPLSEPRSLVNYLDYVDFTDALNDSLYVFPVEVGQTDSFATLLCPDGDGSTVVIVGRQIRENEDAALVPSAIEEAAPEAAQE